MEELMRRSPGRYELCVSHTSRTPRHGEVNGTHYFFVTKEYMQDEIKRNDKYVEGQSALNYKFLEYAEVHGSLYGTSVDSVRNIHERGKVAILDVDTIGVEGIHKLNIVPAKYVFIAPPSLQELEVRLRKRGTEAEEQINLRLKNAVGQMEFGINSEIFDYILENDDLTKAVDELSEKLEEWGLRG
jgi:guanylate kinase